MARVAETMGTNTIVFMADVILDRDVKNLRMVGMGVPEIDVNGFILNKILPVEICAHHPFWQQKYEAQQICRKRLYMGSGNRPIKEIPELAGKMKIDGFLGEVSRLLY